MAMFSVVLHARPGQAQLAPSSSEGSSRSGGLMLSIVNPMPSAGSFVRYTTPGQCLDAMDRLTRLYWRDRRPDTVVYAPATDSIPAPVVHAARACAARFSPSTIPMGELRNLAQLYLWTGQDSAARQTIDRLLQSEHARPAHDRGWPLMLWINALLDARPTRITIMRTYLARLDALGAPAALWRLMAHDRYASYALSVNDRATAESEGRAALAAGRQLSSDERIDWVMSLEQAYAVTALPVGGSRGRTAALALLDTMTADLTPLRPAGSRDQRGLIENLRQERIRFEALGKSGLPRVHANAWYGTNGDSVYPRPGHLSLLIFFSGPDYELFSVLRRLHDRYGTQGLDFVFMSTTQGYFRDMPMPSATVEADSIGSYGHHFVQLPGPVAVEVTDFSYIPDGRRQNTETPNQQAFGHFGGVILIDRHGAIRWVDGLQLATEAMWDAVIRDALQLK